MKKYLLQLILMFSLTYSVNAQSLLNTYWEVYSPTGVLTYYFHIGNDTVFISTNFIDYAPLTSFTTNGDTVVIIDLGLSPVSCPVTDTGQYTFAIQNDSLFYSIISDFCASRATVLTTYIWVRMTTGIEVQNMTNDFKVFPNPSNSGIFNFKIDNIESGINKYSVSSIEGKQILESTLSEKGNIVYTIDLSDLPSGIYLLTFLTEQGNIVYRLMR